MPVVDLNEDKLAKAMAKLDSIQHPNNITQFCKPPIPNFIMYQNQGMTMKNVEKLPELNAKVAANHKILKDRVETPTSKLMTRYKAHNTDRFANLSQLSAETAPGALQTPGPVMNNGGVSPDNSRGLSPASIIKSQPITAKRREMAVFRTSKNFKQMKKVKRNIMQHPPSNTIVDKYQILRSRSFANDIFEEEEEHEDHNNNNTAPIKLTIKDLNEFSQKTINQERISQKQILPIKTTLYNSFVDVKKFKRFLKDPEPPDYCKDYVERRYVNYCDEEKTLRIQEWLFQVNKIHKEEGFWTEVIDKSLIRQQIPKHSSSEMKEMKAGNNVYVSLSRDSTHNISHKLNVLKAQESLDLK